MLPKNSPEQLYASYLPQHEEKISLTKKGVSQGVLTNIQQAFDKADYPTVIRLTKPITDTLGIEADPAYYLNFAMGYSHLQLENAKASLPYFTKLIEVYDQVEPIWYKALACLEFNDIAACKKELNMLLEKSPNSKYGKSARKLLKELRPL